MNGNVASEGNLTTSHSVSSLFSAFPPLRLCEGVGAVNVCKYNDPERKL